MVVQRSARSLTQGSWNSEFSYRWNPQLWSSAGFIVVAINFHGSTSYGSNFTRSILGDWGGKPFLDMQIGLAHVLKEYPCIDPKRVCALGASYGGYLVNWLVTGELII